MNADPNLALDFVGYSVLGRPWTSIRDIMSEFCMNPDVLKGALMLGHGLDVQEKIDRGINPLIYFEIDSDMAARLKQRGVDNPTLLQLIGTSRVFAWTAEECAEKFEKMMQDNDN